MPYPYCHILFYILTKTTNTIINKEFCQIPIVFVKTMSPVSTIPVSVNPVSQIHQTRRRHKPNEHRTERLTMFVLVTYRVRNARHKSPRQIRADYSNYSMSSERLCIVSFFISKYKSKYIPFKNMFYSVDKN